MRSVIITLALVASTACATAPITGRSLEEREEQRRSQDRAELGATAAGVGAAAGAGVVVAAASLLAAPLPQGMTQQDRSNVMLVMVAPGAVMLVGGIGVAAMTASAIASESD